MNNSSLGMLLIVGGLTIAAIGVLLHFGGAWVFSYLGKLPGDLRFEHGNFRIYVPITTTILVSLLLTAIVMVIARFRQ